MRDAPITRHNDAGHTSRPPPTGAVTAHGDADPVTLLRRWLEARLDRPAWQWLDERFAALADDTSDRTVHVTLGMIPRRLPRADLAPSVAERAAADAARTGWDPTAWTLETAARALVLCRLAADDPEGFGERYRTLCRTADLSESLTLFAALPLLPRDARLDAQVGEGLRSNVRAVFEAIAHRNPYPREHFDEHRWNHMVLKALFIDSTLAPIQGLDARANEELATMLIDYAHERRAAGRPITPELWRCVGPFARGATVDDLRDIAENGAAEGDATPEREAALLALAASPDPHAATVLGRHPAIATRIADGTLHWDTLEPVR